MHKIRVYTAACGAILLTALTVAAAAQQDKLASGAERTAQTLERIRAEPLALRDFLKRMPKGADLHSHLSGAVYAETHIRNAIDDGLCVDQDAKAFAKSQPVIAGAEHDPVCEQDQVPATALPKNQRLYNGLVDSFSMRGFVPSGGITGHDHFFDAFAKFGGTDPSHTGEWVDEVAARAARKESVLAQTLFGFELASVDPCVAGINLVGSEDDYAAMADYAVHMRIFQFVRGLHPKLHVSMHAGELTLGLVSPEGLCCHVR